MATIGQGLISKHKVDESKVHNYNKDFHKHLQEINRTMNISKIMNKTNNHDEFKSYTDGTNNNLLKGDLLQEFKKLNVEIKKGDFVSPAPFQLDPSQDYNSEARPKYTYDDFVKTETEFEDEMRKKELYHLKHHLEGIGTGRGPIHMLRRGLTSTIEQSSTENEVKWNEQTEWYTPNTLPTLNMVKALRTQ